LFVEFGLGFEEACGLHEPRSLPNHKTMKEKEKMSCDVVDVEREYERLASEYLRIVKDRKHSNLSRLLALETLEKRMKELDIKLREIEE